MIPSSLWDDWFLFLPLAASLLALYLFWRPLKRRGARSFLLASKTVGPNVVGGMNQALKPPSPGSDLGRRPRRRAPRPQPPPQKSHAMGSRFQRREHLETMLLVTALGGDFAMILLGFGLAALAASRLASLPPPNAAAGYPFVICGSAIAFWGLAGRNLYHYRSLLQPAPSGHKLIQGFVFCLLAFTCIGVMTRPAPLFPWFFYPAAAACIFLNLYCWRILLGWIARRPRFVSRLRRRLVVIGGGSQTWRIQKSLAASSDLEFIGWVQANKPNQVAELDEYRLGPLHELENILRKSSADIAVLTESESLQREGVLAVAKACENVYVQFKMVPHFFEILVSSLRPETIGGVELLGIEDLPLNGFRSRLAKRTVDILGALAGLALAIPLIAIFGTLVYLESPGPILYKQLRLGRYGRCFHILKIRSMKMDAEPEGKAQWTHANDQRRLRIGAFMRRWNIDEVPQFLNVLTGSMSLVGPRPERPELIARFKTKIPHYEARHMYRPGMTGWAQVNGWRGNTDLEERIRHDIWYLEHWSLWLDLRIMLRTFYCRKNAC